MIPITMNERSPFSGITFFASEFSLEKNAFVVPVEKIKSGITRHTQLHTLSDAAKKLYQKIKNSNTGTVRFSMKKVFPLITSYDTYGEI